MKILFLSFYYEPDLCAGSFRNTPLSKELVERLGSGSEVHVVTSKPNRYKTYEVESKKHEKRDKLIIDRIELPSHKSGFFDQINAFKTYFFAALKITKKKEYDLVYASSSRLFTAFLGSYISRKREIPLYLDIRDIFTDTLKDVLKSTLVRFFALPVLKQIEKYTFNRATRINLVSEGFKEYFRQYPKPIYTYYTNGIDDVFLNNDLTPITQDNGKKVVTYAGNIGEGQGLHTIIPNLAESAPNLKFQIIGDGGAFHLLRQEIENKKIKNVDLIPPVERKKLIDFYRRSDYLFLHLNDYDAFKKVLPSKVFEYACFQQPILAGVSGYSADFISKNIKNSIVFYPGDHKGLTSQLDSYEYCLVERKDVRRKFSRKSIMNKMADDIITLGIK